MRSIIAVIAGLIVAMVILTGGTAALAALIIPGGLEAAATTVPPTTYIAGELVLSAMAAVLGGWVTARMAPNREMVHVVALAVLVSLRSVAYFLGNTNAFGMQPGWYVNLIPVIDIGGVLLGGWLRSRVVVTEPA